MNTKTLVNHFFEEHQSEIEVPKCYLCLVELITNGRLSEKFGHDFQITLPDEEHFYCGKYGTKHSKEKALEKGIVAKLKELERWDDENISENEDEEE
uniref:DRBM domain-containing protein n=1 Tax=Strongyloides papillosus TaxID=174720 RepID=A0A0N5BGZ0_STREA